MIERILNWLEQNQDLAPFLFAGGLIIGMYVVILVGKLAGYIGGLL